MPNLGQCRYSLNSLMLLVAVNFVQPSRSVYSKAIAFYNQFVSIPSVT